MKMKAKNIVLSFLSGAALMSLSLGVSLSVGNSVDVQAAQTTKFESPGASIRMNKQDGLNGIRFPMFMDTKTFNSLTSNATIQSEDVTFGTLIIPTDKLTGTLNVNTALAKNLVTYGYEADGDFVNVWTECTDVNYPDCMQGYAYIHSIPDTSLDRNLTAVGYYTVNGGESYVYSQPIERNVSYVADKAIKSGEYSEKQVEKLHDFLANYTITFDVNSQITTQEVKYGKTYDMPDTSMTAAVGSTLDWYEKIGETYSVVDLRNTITATKDAEYQLREVEHVSYETTLYNKENIFGADPSVTYKDGYYYYTYFDSQQKIYVVKSPSLEEILEGGRTGWGHGNIDPVYTPGGELAKKIWAPELVYLRGKWYIYVSGCAESSNGGTFDERMFVLECKSQDPTGEYYAPVQLCPSGFEGKYAIDGHAFEYNGQLYYTFSGRTSNSELVSPHIYICTMSSPTSVNNDAVNISKGSSLEEGPCTIVDGTDLYLMYSKGDYNGVNYRVLYYKLNGTNPLNKNSWSSKGECLQQDSTVDIYCTGHNHIFKGADGGFWTSYHGVVGTAGAGTDTYLATRRVMVQPVSIENGTLQFGGPKDKVTITDKDGLYYYNSEKTEYFVDGEGSGRLWKNEGKPFTASTTITRLSSEKDFCAGITLYERKGDGTLNKLLIGVEEEGNLFFCRDYSRNPYKYKYVGWQWDNKGTVNLTVTYNADAKTIKIDIYQAGQEKPWSKTYTLDEINALVSDKVGNESYAFDLHFTGDFEIGLGGNRGKCKFTNVSFAFEKFDISFIDAYGRKTTKAYEYGTEMVLPQVAERAGFVFLGWAERTGEGTYAEPTLTPNLTVTAAKEYVAKFEAVGPTYEKPAIGANVYSGGAWSEGVDGDGNYKLDAKNGAGAAFFEGVEIEQGQDYVVYATINNVGVDMVGFAIGTLATQSQFAMVAWRNQPDIYTVRLGNGDAWGWAGESSTSVSAKPKASQIALVHKDGSYFFFVDGEQFAYLDAAKINSLAGIGTTQGTIKVGFAVNWSGGTTFTNWGVSTDDSKIREYINPIGTESYTGAYSNIENGIATYTAKTYGTQTFDNVEMAQGTNFVLHATVESGMTAENVGFVIGTFETESKFLMFQWRKNKKDFMVYRDGKGWAGHADGLFSSNIGTNGAEIALVYKNGTYYAFLNGTKVCSFGATFSDGWGGTFNVASQIGTSGNLKVGVSIAYGKAQFSDWGYSTERNVINSYVPDPLTYEKPAIGANVYSGGAWSEGVDGNGNYKLDAKNGAGAAFFKNVEIDQGKDFVLYANISNVSADMVGFAIGTLAEPSTFAMVAWRKNPDIYTVRLGNGSAWGWSGEASAKVSFAPKASKIALVCKGGEYYFFCDGQLLTKLDKAMINKLAGIGSTNDTIKVGFAVNWSGATAFSNWGVSVDSNEIEKYISGTTYTKPAIGANVYSGGAYSEGVDGNGNYKLDTKKGQGAAFFEGVEIEQGKDFVVYANISNVSADMVGFAVGTLASPSSFAMIAWRKNPDIYTVRLGDSNGAWGWAGENITSVSVAPKASKIALVCKGGEYYFFVDGQKIAKLDKAMINKLAGIGTTEGAIKVGFAVNWSGSTTFSNWGVSTLTTDIAQYAV